MDIRSRWEEFTNLPLQTRLELFGMKFTKHEYMGPINKNQVIKIMRQKGCDCCYFQFQELEDGYDSDYSEDQSGMIQITKTGNIFETIGNLKEEKPDPSLNIYANYHRDDFGLKFFSDIKVVSSTRKTMMGQETDWMRIRGNHEYPLELVKMVVLTIGNDTVESELHNKYKQLLFDTSRAQVLGMNNFCAIRPIK